MLTTEYRLDMGTHVLQYHINHAPSENRISPRSGCRC